MNRSALIRPLLVAALLVPITASAQGLEPVALPIPQTDGGKPLMQVLKERHTSREFSEKRLPAQVLSNLLWAAFGINRPDSGKRTAPSASNRQEIDIYVAMASGLYVYDPKAHRLAPVRGEDVRSATGKQPFVSVAPMNLVYVADFAKMGGSSEEDKVFYSAANTGFIAENVYLFCTSEGLSTVVRGLVDREALAKIMKLEPSQRVILAQTVGYPK
jgi:SagB-type dehydrogenase family enzyme